MRGKVGVYNRALWRMRRVIASVTGMEPARRLFSARDLSAVAGWGYKPTAAFARAVAARNGLPYLAIEDGFFRSRRPGPDEPSLSYVCDPFGIYYEAGGPSTLETMIVERARDPARAAGDAEVAVHAIRILGLSKYAEVDLTARASLLRAAERARPVIVVDQTFGDAAVAGAGADRATFRAMLIAAVEENPDRPVLLKVHPETRLGRRAGYFDDALIAEACAASPAVAEARAARRITALAGAVAPRDVAAAAHRLYVVSSLLGLEALIAGAAVTAFGRSFYVGWGLTDDRAPAPVHRATVNRAPAPLECLVAAAYRDYAIYLSPMDGSRCGIEEAIAALAKGAGSR